MEDIKRLEKIEDFKNSYMKLCTKQELTEREKRVSFGMCINIAKDI